jgi:hypothetical protein
MKTLIESGRIDSLLLTIDPHHWGRFNIDFNSGFNTLATLLSPHYHAYIISRAPSCEAVATEEPELPLVKDVSLAYLSWSNSSHLRNLLSNMREEKVRCTFFFSKVLVSEGVKSHSFHAFTVNALEGKYVSEG